MIGKAIEDADRKGVKVLSLGLLNQVTNFHCPHFSNSIIMFIFFTNFSNLTFFFLLNSLNVQHDDFSRNVELYMKKNPHLKIKVVDGSSLAAAIVLNSIPKETTQVLVRGRVSKEACILVQALCEKGIKVIKLPITPLKTI